MTRAEKEERGERKKSQETICAENHSLKNIRVRKEAQIKQGKGQTPKSKKA